MSGYRVLPASERRAQPWKNGGGLTTEVACHPAGAGIETFAWRVSIADVEAEGPFSRFDGVDRVLTVLSGVLVLTVDRHGTVRLDEDSTPHAFPGDLTARGVPTDGAVRDLNVMTRRGVCTASVERVVMAAGSQRAWTTRSTTLLLAMRQVSVAVAGQMVTLSALDALRVDDGLELVVSADGTDTTVFVVSIEPGRL